MDPNSFLLSFRMKSDDFGRTDCPIPSDDDLANTKMEDDDDVVQTMIDTAYEHQNYDPFRKRSS